MTSANFIMLFASLLLALSACSIGQQKSERLPQWVGAEANWNDTPEARQEHLRLTTELGCRVSEKSTKLWQHLQKRWSGENRFFGALPLQFCQFKRDSSPVMHLGWSGILVDRRWVATTANEAEFLAGVLFEFEWDKWKRTPAIERLDPVSISIQNTIQWMIYWRIDPRGFLRYLNYRESRLGSIGRSAEGLLPLDVLTREQRKLAPPIDPTVDSKVYRSFRKSLAPLE
jgi:hypothetical protein